MDKLRQRRNLPRRRHSAGQVSKFLKSRIATVLLTARDLLGIYRQGRSEANMRQIIFFESLNAYFCVRNAKRNRQYNLSCPCHCHCGNMGADLHLYKGSAHGRAFSRGDFPGTLLDRIFRNVAFLPVGQGIRCFRSRWLPGHPGRCPG